MDPTEVTITAREYFDLIGDSMFLEILESEGVGNWEGYDRAIERYEDDLEEDEDF